MVYGLPCSILEMALLWGPTQGLQRRFEFPSWSWAGWIGGVQLNTDVSSSILEKWLTHQTLIVWEHCELDASRPLIIEYTADFLGGADIQLPFEPQGIPGSFDSDNHKQPIIPARFSFTPSMSSKVPLNRFSQHRTGHDCPRIKFIRSKNKGPILHFWALSANLRISSKSIKPNGPIPCLCLFGMKLTRLYHMLKY